jgi:diadenylate cyclase
VGGPLGGGDAVNLLDQFRLLGPSWRDVVEILVVATVLYRIMLLFHGTRALQMLAGVVVLVFAYALAWILKLNMITYLLQVVFTYGAFAGLIVFQPELRAALAHLGQSRVTRFFRRMEESEVAEEISDAVERLSRSAIGALIAVEREVPLGDYVTSGTEMQAKVSAELLQTIFTPYSPLHDGAVIIRGDTIIGAGCILPLSQAPVIDRSLGTRHRAALGLAEETDAIVVVVSEETARISVAQHSQLVRGLTALQVKDLLAGRTMRTSTEIPMIPAEP